MIALIVGADVPHSLVRAAGLDPIPVGLPVLDEHLGRDSVVCVVLSHLRAENARAYHRMRNQGGAGMPALVFLDLPPADGPAERAYAEARLRECGARLAALTGVRLDDQALRTAIDTTPAEDVGAAVDGGTVGGERVVLVGADRVTDAIDRLQRAGHQVAWVEREEGYGSASPDPGALPSAGQATDPWQYLVDAHFVSARTSTRASLTSRAAALLDAADRQGAGTIVLAAEPLDDVSAWLRSVLERSNPPRRLRVTSLEELLGESGSNARPEPSVPRARASAHSARPRPERSRKSLESIAGFSAYQREWFAGVRERAARGEPFAMVNADAPQELLRALDVPFVVNQWWASIVAAKQATPRYIRALGQERFPTAHETYNSQGLADLFVPTEEAPWGGLPRPDVLQAVRGEDAITGVFEQWAELTGAELVLFDRTVECREEFPVDWWDRMPDHWNSALERERLDLMTEQLRASIPRVERRTGRRLDPARLLEVLHVVNEQEEYYRRTRDLIAATRPAPVSIVDTMPATMIPQWHRGTVWGRDAARMFYDEVAARVRAGQGVVQQERARLMWVGRGTWQNMRLYQAFEESHGAVFVWSMYLGLAADGYLRRLREGSDPLRSLASRFVTMGDELRMPSWAAAWHVAEARRHEIDAVVAIADAEASVLTALEAEGLPVLRLDMDNLAGDRFDDATTRIAAFLDDQVVRGV